VWIQSTLLLSFDHRPDEQNIFEVSYDIAGGAPGLIGIINQSCNISHHMRCLHNYIKLNHNVYDQVSCADFYHLECNAGFLILQIDMLSPQI